MRRLLLDLAHSLHQRFFALLGCSLTIGLQQLAEMAYEFGIRQEVSPVGTRRR